LMGVMLAPAWIRIDVTSFESWAEVVNSIANYRANPGPLVICVAAGFMLLYMLAGITLIALNRRLLNYLLRLSIIFFNVTYPFNAISSVFWIIIPPWISISGAFPFSFQPIFAIAGSLVLRIVEWAIVLQTKKEAEINGTQLREYSIFRSQQMNEVTVPLKLRSLLKGLSSGWDDVVGKKDNSFWVSFGTAKAVQSVQAWLCAVMTTMVASVIAAIVNIIIYGDQNTVMACVFGLVLAIIQIWILWEPTWFVMRGRQLKVSMRHTEVLVLLAIGFAFVLFSSSVALTRAVVS